MPPCMALSMGSGDFTQSLCLCGMHFTNSHRSLLGAYFEYIRVFRILLIFPYCSNTCKPVSCLFTAQSYICTHIYTHVHINTAQSYAHTPIPLYMCSQVFTCACNCQMCLCNTVPGEIRTSAYSPQIGNHNRPREEHHQSPAWWTGEIFGG